MPHAIELAKTLTKCEGDARQQYWLVNTGLLLAQRVAPETLGHQSRGYQLFVVQWKMASRIKRLRL